MQDAVISDPNLMMKAALENRYKTELISPRITVPWPTVIYLPNVTSPTMVALGAMKGLPTAMGVSSYKGITALAFEIDYEYFFGASIALVQKSALMRVRFARFFNMIIKYYLIVKSLIIIQIR